MLSLLVAAAIQTAWVVPAPHVLVFSKTTGFRHDSIPSAIAAIKKLGTEHGFQVDATEDSAVFNDENLKKYDLVCFASTTGDILDGGQQKALEHFVEGGKGWVGIHAASDTEYDWPWYSELVGAYFKSHPPGGQRVHVKIENRGNPSTANLPRFWVRPDEWYDWKANPRGKVTVLASLDESFYRPEPQDHPIAWCHWQGKGRAWYTEMGHFKEAYAEKEFVEHIYGGLMWAAQGSAKLAGAQDLTWKSTDGWQSTTEGLSNTQTERAPLVTKDEYGDCHLHAEFKIAKGTNAGVYLQSRYELLINDSQDVPQEKLRFTDCGGIFRRFDEKTKIGYGGTTPLVNAFLGRDEWNVYDIVFRAPRFRGGSKIEDARFVEVRLNGIVVQKDQPVTGPTQAATYSNEKPTGPLALQFGKGPIVYRNMWIKKLSL